MNSSFQKIETNLNVNLKKLFETVKELIEDYYDGLQIVKKQKEEEGEVFNISLVAPEKIAQLKSKPFSFLKLNA